MSRLVAFDLCIGRRIRIDGQAYHVVHAIPSAPVLTLKSEHDGSTMVSSRSELAALVVMERAEFIDELEEPEAEPSRPITELTSLPLHRVVDWLCKLFLLRRLMRYSGQSPKSKIFMIGYQQACSELEQALSRFGLQGFKPWSSWTIYHDLLRMRINRFEISAIQTKGVEYCPHRIGNPIYQETAALAQELRLESPHLSVKSIAKEVNNRLQLKATGKAPRTKG
jgi:hypothetical protein